jgi:hypothetical protein
VILPVAGLGTGSPTADARTAGEKRIDSKSQWFIFFTLLIGEAENQYQYKTIGQKPHSMAPPGVMATHG